MEIIAIVGFFVLSFVPLLAYGLYTARFGEPIKADKVRAPRGRRA